MAMYINTISRIICIVFILILCCKATSVDEASLRRTIDHIQRNESLLQFDENYYKQLPTLLQAISKSSFETLEELPKLNILPIDIHSLNYYISSDEEISASHQLQLLILSSCGLVEYLCPIPRADAYDNKKNIPWRGTEREDVNLIVNIWRLYLTYIYEIILTEYNQQLNLPDIYSLYLPAGTAESSYPPQHQHLQAIMEKTKMVPWSLENLHEIREQIIFKIKGMKQFHITNGHILDMTYWREPEKLYMTYHIDPSILLQCYQKYLLTALTRFNYPLNRHQHKNAILIVALHGYSQGRFDLFRAFRQSMGHTAEYELLITIYDAMNYHTLDDSPEIRSMDVYIDDQVIYKLICDLWNEHQNWRINDAVKQIIIDDIIVKSHNKWFIDYNQPEAVSEIKKLGDQHTLFDKALIMKLVDGYQGTVRKHEWLKAIVHALYDCRSDWYYDERLSSFIPVDKVAQQARRQHQHQPSGDAIALRLLRKS